MSTTMIRYLRAPALLLSCLLIACAPGGDSAVEAPEAGGVDPGTSELPPGMHYSGRVDFDPEAGTLAADMTVRTEIVEGDETSFVMAGELEVTEVSGDGVTGFSAAPMSEGASWDRITIALDPERTPGPLEIRFAYSGAPEMPESRINQITPEWVELSVDSGWHPIPGNLADEFTLELELGLPSDWAVVTPGEAESIAEGFVIRNRVPHGDIVFVAAPSLDMVAGEGARVYHRGEPLEVINAVLEAAATCRAYLDSRFRAGGTLPDGRFVIPDRDESGYARKNFIALTNLEGTTPERLTGFLCHELSHFWSSGAAWNTVDNWLNESFAVLVAAQAVRENFGEEAWQQTVDGWTERAAGQPSIWTPDKLERRPFEINYKKGPLALARLEEKIGAEAFDRLVVRYMTEPIDDTPSLLAAVEDEGGAEVRTWFEAVLAEDDSD